MSDITIKIPAALLRDLVRIAEAALDKSATTAHEAARETAFGAPRMTDPQRRMIYRLGFQLGNDADAVRDLIRHRLGAEPTRDGASDLIDQLQAQVRRKTENGGSREAS